MSNTTLKKIVKEHRIPCLYCNTECIFYELEGDTEEYVKKNLELYNDMIKLHTYYEHKDIIFVQVDRPFINKDGDIVNNVQ
jgi:hypothetical protein